MAIQALKLANGNDIYEELEKKEFRNTLFKTVCPTYEDGLAFKQKYLEFEEKAADSYTALMETLMKIPLLKMALKESEEKPVALGRLKSFFADKKRITAELLKERYVE